MHTQWCENIFLFLISDSLSIRLWRVLGNSYDVCDSLRNFSYVHVDEKHAVGGTLPKGEHAPVRLLWSRVHVGF